MLRLVLLVPRSLHVDRAKVWSGGKAWTALSSARRPAQGGGEGDGGRPLEALVAALGRGLAHLGELLAPARDAVGGTLISLGYQLHNLLCALPPKGCCGPGAGVRLPGSPRCERRAVRDTLCTQSSSGKADGVIWRA